MKLSFAKKISKILSNCQSVDEFKCYCATHGIDIPSKELSFAKWFYDLAVRQHYVKPIDKHQLPALAKLKSVPYRFYPSDWRIKFKRYLEENIDDIVTPKMFKDLLVTRLSVLAVDEDEWCKSNTRAEFQKEVSMYSGGYHSISPKERLAIIWKKKNKLKTTDFSTLLVLAYFKRHGLQLSLQ